MESTREHHHHRKRTGLSQSRIERFVTSRLFLVLGILSLLIAFYSISSGEGGNNIYNLLAGFLTPAAESLNLPVKAGNGLSSISENGLPELLPFFIASLFLLLIAFGLLASNFLHHKNMLLVLTCFFFYASVVYYAAKYTLDYDYLFTYTILFSIAIAWIGRKIEKPDIQWINPAFAWSFFGLFWLRKFVVNAKPEFLQMFFIFGILFYLLFYVLVVIIPENKKHPTTKLMQLVVAWANLLVFLGTTSYVINKYYDFAYLWIFVTALLIFNILGLYLIKRFKSPVWTLPHHFGIILLASLFLPLLLRQNMVLLFTAVLNVLMLSYANKYKERSAFWISLFSVTVMIVFYLLTWVRLYFPALCAELSIPKGALMVHGIVSGGAVIGALAATHWVLATADLPLSKRWFNKREYGRMIRVILLFSLFLTLVWTGIFHLLRGYRHVNLCPTRMVYHRRTVFHWHNQILQGPAVVI